MLAESIPFHAGARISGLKRTIERTQILWHQFVANGPLKQMRHDVPIPVPRNIRNIKAQKLLLELLRIDLSGNTIRPSMFDPEPESLTVAVKHVRCE